MGGGRERWENLLAAVSRKQMGLQIGFKYSSRLNARQGMPDRRSSIGKGAMSKCFGLNAWNALCS